MDGIVSEDDTQLWLVNGFPVVVPQFFESVQVLCCILFEQVSHAEQDQIGAHEVT